MSDTVFLEARLTNDERKSENRDANVGDVFRVRFNDERCGYGQVLDGGDVLLMAIFEPLYNIDSAVDIHSVVSAPKLLVAASLDALIWHGMWSVVGNVSPNLSDVPLPYYKVEREDGTMVAEAYDRSQVLAGNECVEKLRYRKTVAPIRLENAFKAFHGLQQWEDYYDELLFIEWCDYAKLSNECAARQNDCT